MSGSGKRVCPVTGGHGGLEQQRASDVVGGAKHAFGFSILLGGVGAGHAETHTFSKEESTSGSIVELTAIVTLHRFDGATELSEYIGKKMRESGKGVRL
jgi:hypothetical protein